MISKRVIFMAWLFDSIGWLIVGALIGYHVGAN